MGQFLKEITLTADRPLQPKDATVENMSRVVCALFIQGLQPRVLSPDFWKISIRINSNNSSESRKVLLGVLIQNAKFPVSEFVEWSLKRRQNFMLEFVSDSVREIFRHHGLPAAQLESAASYVAMESFKNLIIGEKKFKHPGGDEVAHIECEQEMDQARIYVVLKGRGSERRALVATTAPEEFIFQSFFGRVEWDDLQPVLRKVDGAIIPVEVPSRH